MCHCTPEATAYRFCMKGECNLADYNKKVQAVEIYNQSKLISNRENARICENLVWKDTEDQWKIILKKCKEIGLSVIDTKALRKLENFHTKIDMAVRDYPNY